MGIIRPFFFELIVVSTVSYSTTTLAFTVNERRKTRIQFSLQRMFGAIALVSIPLAIIPQIEDGVESVGLWILFLGPYAIAAIGTLFWGWRGTVNGTILGVVLVTLIFIVAAVGSVLLTVRAR